MPNFSFLVCLEVVVLWLETTKTKQQNSVELEASLAPAEAEVGAVAKADQKYLDLSLLCSPSSSAKTLFAYTEIGYKNDQ